MASPRGKSSQEPTRTLPERVGQLYYAHGLFCSSHPVPVISFAVAIVLLCCYPLLNLPLPGNVPQQLSGDFSVLRQNRSEIGDAQLPRWFMGLPLCYVLQVVMRTAVSPWTEDLVLTDAFRAPLAEVFKLLEVIRNYQLENSSMSLSHMCLHIESAKVKSDKKMALPEYNCLALSPANLWQQDQEKFQEDSNLLGTIFTYENLQKGKISLAEILFGMHMKDTGIKRYPLRTRQRVLQYAITLVLQKHDPRFVDGLRQRLAALYPLHQPHNSQWPSSSDITSNTTTLPPQEVLHIYFPGQFNLREFVPLTVTYFILFLYMYFSVRKIELVRSKVGMAFSAVVTVLASLSMSVGLCFFFGLTLTLTGKEIFPYLVVIVGLENILVLTKSVVSTPTHLDVKIRVAQGLSREGWSITKNLLIEVTILTVGLFTFVPAIQEFCIFAVVGLLSDYFLQMLFFSTVLAIDIRRMELSSESQHHRIPYAPLHVAASSRTPLRQFHSSVAASVAGLDKTRACGIMRSVSHPGLNGLSLSSYPTDVVAPLNSPPAVAKVPKRLRLVHFWASTRIFQRAFMVCMIVWITVIMYSSGVLEHVLQLTTEEGISERDELIGSVPGEHQETVRRYHDMHTRAHSPLDSKDLKTLHSVTTEESRAVSPTLAVELGKPRGGADSPVVTEGNDAIAKLKHMGYDPWKRLSHYHWPAILSLYNISLSGHYITILPPIRLSHAVSSAQARALRNPDEKAAQHFQWQTLAAALDPLDFSDGGESGKGPVVGIKSMGGSVTNSEVPFVPSSPMELFLTAVLCVVSIVVVAYTMVMLYRCVCSRNYAEWRASWAGDGEGVTADGTTQVVMEAVPLVLDGHPQEVECLATDGCVVVSSCLGGQLRVWDSVSGEALAVVNRRHYFLAKQRDSDVADPEEVVLSGCESGSPSSCLEKMGMVDNSNSSPPLLHHTCSRHRNLPDLRPTINMNFTGNRPTDYDASNPYRHVHMSGFDFTVSCEDLHDVLTHPMDSDSDEDGIWNVTTLKQSKPNKPTPHLQYTVPLPTKQFSEDLVSKSCLCQCQGLIDKCGITQQRRFSGHVEHCDGGTLGSKCSDSCRRQAADSVVLCYSSHHEDSCPRRWKETEFCDVTCGGNSICLTTGHSLPVNTDSPSRAIDVDRRQCHAFCHKSPPKEAIEICGERGPTVDIVQQRPPIWCLDCHENLIAVGCANGRLEFWEGTTATFKCLFQDGSGVGVTAVKIIGNRVVAAKLSGSVDFLELKSYSHGRQMDWGFTAYRRTHVRSGSTGSIVDWDSIMSCEGNEEDLRCIRLNTTRAHQQPITVLDSVGGRVLTGSKDHTLKVFRLEDQLPLYTLHGHCGPITCLFIDRISPMMSGSGSQDGLLCVWDLLTGACMYSLQAHDGSVTALTYSASYVISLGTDERLCVWERFQGHLLNTIQMSHTYCSSMVMFTHNLLITSKQGSLVVWDVRTGDPVRVVKLGHCDGSVFVKQILLLRDSVACDYGNQLRIVHFPLVVTDKCE